MLSLLAENEILLLFVVAAIGYALSKVRILGTSLGIAAVLFVGLIVGGLDPELRMSEVVIWLGLSIFVYSIGLNSGPSFFSTFKERGGRDILFILLMLALSASLAIGLHYLLHFEAAITSGLYAGGSTNTPALAGLLDVISKGDSAEFIRTEQEKAVTGYSLTYPMGVIGAMVAIALVQRLLNIDFKDEEQKLEHLYPSRRELSNMNIRVSWSNPEKLQIRDLIRNHKWTIVFGRMSRDGEMSLSSYDTILQPGDQIMAVGSEHAVKEVTAFLGEKSDKKLTYDRSEYDYRRIFVSNPEVAGQKIASLNLNEKFSALITRIRRGDIDLLANGSTVLELGDRVRFVARRKEMSRVSRLFGDSYEALSKIDLFSFGLGMALGLILGMMTFELGDYSFRLGMAGGPLIVGLLLGALRRTGPIVWSLPFSANISLRQIGLIFMLAGIGVNSGYNFFSIVGSGGGGWIFLAGSIFSFLTATFTLIIGYKILKIPFSILLGMVATQPAILDYAMEKTDNKLPVIGFTLMLPVAVVFKIIFTQFLYSFLS